MSKGNTPIRVRSKKYQIMLLYYVIGITICKMNKDKDMKTSSLFFFSSNYYVDVVIAYQKAISWIINQKNKRQLKSEELF